MPLLRALLAWVVLPLLVALLAPGLFRLLPMLRDGLLYEWLRDLSLLERIALGLLAATLITLPALRRVQLRRDLLAARRFIPLWRGRGPGDAGPLRVEHAGANWTAAVGREPGEVAVSGDGREQDRRDLERLLRLAWRLHCASERRARS